MFVKPPAGRMVRRPDPRALLPAEGAEVPRDGFWLRRLRDRDVTEVTPQHEADAAVHDAAKEAAQ